MAWAVVNETLNMLGLDPIKLEWLLNDFTGDVDYLMKTVERGGSPAELIRVCSSDVLVLKVVLTTSSKLSVGNCRADED